MRRLCATVLVMEVVVIWLAIPVAVVIEHAPARAAITSGVIMAVSAAVLAAAARWYLKATLIGGSVLQALAIAAGVVVPAMYVLGAIFAALWVTGIWLGYRVEHAS